MVLSITALLLVSLAGQAEKDATAKADAVVCSKADPSEIVITTTKRLAGAIHSVTWNGKEFIDSTDHGRQLQSASSLAVDLSVPPPVPRETLRYGRGYDGPGRPVPARRGPHPGRAA